MEVSLGAQDEFPDTAKQRCLDFKWNNRYPRPELPRQKKDEIFIIDQYRGQDNKTKQVSIDNVYSIRDLVAKLTVGLVTDLDKVRAIFTWLGAQKVLTMDFSKSKIHDTVKGYLKIVQQDRSTYTEIMAMLCREARVPCVVLSGPAKGADYIVGEAVSGRSSWNAVYVAEGWRFIHAQWAFSRISGQENCDWVMLESENGRVCQDVPRKGGKEESVINEFFFLTDPEIFIHFCCPDEPHWQLLKLKVSVEKFTLMPYAQPHAFKSGITFKRSQSCSEKAEHGESRISLSAPTDSKPKLCYDLFLKRNEFTDTSLLNGKEGLVIQSNIQTNGIIPFFVRFLVKGIYRLRIYKEFKERKYWLCDFKIDSEEAKPFCSSFPFIPEIGWGPGPLAKHYGLYGFSHEDGLVLTHDATMVELSFKMTRTLIFQILLKSDSKPDNELMHSAKLAIRYDQVRVNVVVPDDGEYVIKIDARKESEKETDTRNILNYVIEADPKQRKYKGRDNAAQKKARQNIREATRAGNRTVLSIAIDRFRKQDCEDKGDLTKATEVLDELDTKEDLRFAMLKNRFDKLEDAIGKAKNSPRSERFQTLVMAAIEQKEKLQIPIPADKGRPEVTKRTVADLKSYKTPPAIVHQIVKAAYLVLGEKMDMLDTWSNIRTMLHKVGRNSLDFRLQNDPGFDENNDDILIAEAKAMDILNQYNAQTVGKMSPAGEAVFIQTQLLLERRQQARMKDAEDNEDTEKDKPQL
ncbi:hillarin-like [Haliotis rufescens]|uniref:hillarin-like n=1 Tax=Haliotis rufescens TaxID=6454 RepID=UPI00201F94C7|nr:hillarin-like [Haliotis rufescens]